ncbi:MAG TPA: regulatory protein RecX [Bacteroidales bacterium]|jgi:regulatory protein|nr:RecX family transcriptional regulator [Bacteroidales bacterium]MDI9574031.1 regulatory protein RecX [Bacteroidota bacterium]OQC59742.1 MAG: recombination regulator RecX [Bacteroidetes bacterium ADurb.Bin012]MBP9512521.1 RecX family transcriptional regulator [Bacteroidales bacterium]MBP9589053.1 RecX family transcriptional regulator [Bacteroidales bacterium]
MKNPSSKIHSSDEGLFEKAKRWCAFEERCSYDLRLKLEQWGVTEDKISEIIQQLTREGFIDDGRFARMFVQGKFHNLKWGKIKIKAELQRHHISNELTEQAIALLDDDEYKKSLLKILNNKRKSLSKELPDVARQKLIRFALSKGYEAELIYSLLGKTNLIEE